MPLKRKRLFPLMLSVAMLLSLAAPAFGAGDPNIDGGGGDMGLGSNTCYWNGDDGVRISVITNSGSKVACFDWSRLDESNVKCSFGQHNKLDYKSGYSLMPFFDSYHSSAPTVALPRVVSTNGRNNIATIRSYFTSSGPLQNVAADAGIAYDDLIGGDYKLLIEPMAYFYYNSIKYACTATEAALLDVQMGGGVKYWVGRCTHQNLPLSMYLERNDTELGLYHWTGRTTGKQDNLDIINYLGMGLVTFTEPPEEDPSEYDFEFHCDTDVIIAFPITSTIEVTPDDDKYITLNTGSGSIAKQYVCPAGGEQLIWMRWHTPTTPQEITMHATGASQPVTLHVNVILLEENEPPDPTFYDTNSGFTLNSPPDHGNTDRTTWSEWTVNWDAEEDAWVFDYVSYEARLNCTFKLEPDDRCQTDYESSYGTVMPSGYGVQAKVTTTLSRGSGVDVYDVTQPQFVIATFPEFKYETYNRFLEKAAGGDWQFKQNVHSYYGSRIHYTPLWYPDDTYYPVLFDVIDAWTPGGELHVSKTEQLYIFQSCLDDWYIHNIR